MFEVPGQPCPGGGITRVDPDDWNSTEGKKKGVVLYLYVSDIYAYEQVSEFIRREDRCLGAFFITITVGCWLLAVGSGSDSDSAMSSLPPPFHSSAMVVWNLGFLVPWTLRGLST